MAKEQEREFKLEELFFSTTDRHGKVTSGNEVFSRVSGYSFAELLGKPHSIIRHPDMPRCVFRLLWDTIGAHKPIAAYVKNKAKDGRYYWVLAYVSECPEGYVSVRFKPSSPFHGVVEDLYKKLRDAELEIESKPGATKDQAIARSKEMLMGALNSLGFADYDAFIETALYAEFCSRQAVLDKSGTGQVRTVTRGTIDEILAVISEKLRSILSRHEDFAAMERNVNDTTQFIGALSVRVQRAALNLTVRSEQSNSAGSSLSVIASWLRDGSSQIQSEIERLMQPVKTQLRQLKTGLFSIATSQLQVEMMQYFMRERASLSEEVRGYNDAEADRLIKLLAGNAEKTFVSSLGQLKQLGSAIRSVSYAFSDLQREVMGLCLAHVNGRVECARMPDASSFEIILQDAMGDITEARAYLDKLEFSFSALDQLMKGFGNTTVTLTEKYKVLRSRFAA